MSLASNAAAYAAAHRGKTQEQILREASKPAPAPTPAPIQTQSKVPSYLDLAKNITVTPTKSSSQNQSKAPQYLDLATQSSQVSPQQVQNTIQNIATPPQATPQQTTTTPPPTTQPSQQGRVPGAQQPTMPKQSSVPKYTDAAKNIPQDLEAPYGRWPSGVPIRFDETGMAMPITPSDMLDLTPTGGAKALLMGTTVKPLLGSLIVKKTLAETAEWQAKMFAAWEVKQSAARLISPLEKKGAAVLSGEVGKEINNAAAGAAVKVGAGEIAVNTATAAAKLTWLKSFVKNMKYPTMIAGVAAGWLMSGTFAYNELNDAIFSISFKASEAIKAGDAEYAQELNDRMAELNKLNNIGFVFGGPVSYVIAATTKGHSSVEESQIAIDKLKVEQKADADFLKKYQEGSALNSEIAAYAKANPYSSVADTLKAAQKNLDANGNSIFGTLDEKGNYIPSATELARQEWEANNNNVDANGNSIYGAVNENGVYVPSYTELAKRLESQQYYNSLSGGSSATTQGEYQPPSSLNFGLLRTAGGYETAKKTPDNAGQMITDVNTVSNYYFQIPYSDLSPEQRALIDMMVG
jgi:hypothetical protein